MTAKLKTPLCGHCQDGWICDDATGLPVRRCPCRFATSPEQERDTAIAAVTAAREQQFEAAKKVIEDCAATYEQFSANDVRDRMTDAGIEARNVIGAAFLACRDAGLIEATALSVKSSDPGTHAHRLTVWKVCRDVPAAGMTPGKRSA